MPMLIFVQIRLNPSKSIQIRLKSSRLSDLVLKAISASYIIPQIYCLFSSDSVWNCPMVSEVSSQISAPWTSIPWRINQHRCRRYHNTTCWCSNASDFVQNYPNLSKTFGCVFRFCSLAYPATFVASWNNHRRIVTSYIILSQAPDHKRTFEGLL